MRETVISESNGIKIEICVDENTQKILAKYNSLSDREIDRLVLLANVLVFEKELMEKRENEILLTVNRDFEATFIFELISKTQSYFYLQLIDIIKNENVKISVGFSTQNITRMVDSLLSKVNVK